MQVQFINHTEWGINKDQFDLYIQRLKGHVPDTQGTLNVVFVDDPYIHALNAQYRKKDKPTDVLSFSYLDTPDFNEGMHLIGEIYISFPTAERQANEYSWPVERELNKLFVHGFLHIFGYDHETDEEYQEMHAIEKVVLMNE